MCNQRELESFDAKAHWFCPRRSDDDPADYDNPDDDEEDMSHETKEEIIEESKRRHDVAYRYSTIIGISPEVSGRLLTAYTTRLHKILMHCDKCVHNWHLGRKAHLKYLSE